MLGVALAGCFRLMWGLVQYMILPLGPVFLFGSIVDFRVCGFWVDAGSFHCLVCLIVVWVLICGC